MTSLGRGELSEMIFHKKKCCLVYYKSQRQSSITFRWKDLDRFPLFAKEKKKQLSSFFLPERNAVFFLKKFMSFIPVFHPQRFFPLNTFIKKL